MKYPIVNTIFFRKDIYGYPGTYWPVYVLIFGKRVKIPLAWLRIA